jgi:hypothetical protein
MSDWLHNLPVVWMALVVFGVTYLVAAAIHAVVTVLAVGERARSFKAVSPGMLPPLGIIFGLLSRSLLPRSGTITIGRGGQPRGERAESGRDPRRQLPGRARSALARPDPPVH